MKTALTIAGSDSSGGAGIQADIKTMTANGVFALSAITALTAQNTTGVTGIFETTPEFLAQQLDAVFTDIYPDAIKIGMVSSSALIETIAKKLRQYDAKHIVVDPVMVATSGSKLLQDSAIQILTGQLLPIAEVVTPNIPEAEILSGMTITDAAGMEAAAKCISEKYGCAVLCKGGHKVNDADDLLWRNGSGKWFHGERIAPIWQRAIPWLPPLSGPRHIFQAACPPCSIWAKAPAPWTTCSPCAANSWSTEPQKKGDDLSYAPEQDSQSRRQQDHSDGRRGFLRPLLPDKMHRP